MGAIWRIELALGSGKYPINKVFFLGKSSANGGFAMFDHQRVSNFQSLDMTTK